MHSVGKLGVCGSSSYKESRNKIPIYGYSLPNLSPSPNLYKVQSVYNNNVRSFVILTLGTTGVCVLLHCKNVRVILPFSGLALLQRFLCC